MPTILLTSSSLITSGVATPKDVADIIRDNFNIDIPTDRKDWSEVIPAIGMAKGLEIMFNTMSQSGTVLDVDIDSTHFQKVPVIDPNANNNPRATERKPRPSQAKRKPANPGAGA